MPSNAQNTHDEFCQISRELADEVQVFCQHVDSFHEDVNLQHDETAGLKNDLNFK